MSYRDANMFTIVAREFKPTCVQERVSPGYVVSSKPNSTTDPRTATICPPGGYVLLPGTRRGESGRYEKTIAPVNFYRSNQISLVEQDFLLGICTIQRDNLNLKLGKVWNSWIAFTANKNQKICCTEEARQRRALLRPGAAEVDFRIVRRNQRIYRQHTSVGRQGVSSFDVAVHQHGSVA